MQFKDLKIGQTFDFVSGQPLMDSFLDRCCKVSARKYVSLADPRELNFRPEMRVGSITVEVYHVGE